MPTLLPRMAVVLLATAVLPAFTQQIVVSKDNRTIAVTTSAEAHAEADTVTVQIGFLVYGPDQDAAYALGSKTSNAIADALKAGGVPSDAIESESQAISAVQQYGNNDLTAAEKAERKFQVQQTWSVADQDALQAKAAKLALDRAHGIAQQMAVGLNATLGPLVYASNEAPARGPQPMMSFKESGAPASARAVAPLSVSAQKVTASATVYAVFSIQ